MKNIDIFKKIKKYSKLSLIFTTLIFVISIISFAIIPGILFAINKNDPWANLNNNETFDFIFVALLTISGILIFIFTILIFAWNIMVIINSCLLEDSKDKTLLIVMSILGMVWLGLISNIVVLIISNSNIKRLLSNKHNSESVSKTESEMSANISNENIAQ